MMTIFPLKITQMSSSFIYDKNSFIVLAFLSFLQLNFPVNDLFCIKLQAIFRERNIFCKAGFFIFFIGDGSDGLISTQRPVRIIYGAMLVLTFGSHIFQTKNPFCRVISNPSLGDISLQNQPCFLDHLIF